MKKSLIASVVFGALMAGSAVAADMPARAPMLTKAPPAPVYSWTGFYIDGGAGYGTWTADTTTVSPVTGICQLCTTQTQGGKGWLGTVSAGFDYQFSQHIVAGILADYDFSDIKGTIQDQGPFFAGTVSQKSAWAAGARVGWLVTPQILSYVNGGYTQAHFSGANMVTTFVGMPANFSTPSFNTNGWFLGGGVEVSLASFIPGLFSRNEYRYSSYNSVTLTDTCPRASGSAACGGFATPQNSITFHPYVQTVRSELVYKFNWMH